MRGPFRLLRRPSFLSTALLVIAALVMQPSRKLLGLYDVEPLHPLNLANS